MDEKKIQEEYVELKKKHSLTDKVLQQKITKEHSFAVDQFISWRIVGPKLPRMKQRDVNDIDVEVRGGAREEARKRRKFMDLWKEKNGDNATYEALIRAMISEELNGEATSVCELLSAGQ